VTVAKPVRKTVTEYEYFTGTMEPVRSVEIRARVKGFLVSADFEDGQRVAADAQLFIIERAPFETALAAAEAKVKQTQAALKLAEANLSRDKQLYETKRSITSQQLQTTEAQRDAAAAELDRDVAAMNQAIIDLNYTVVRSPIAGKMGRRLVDPGNLVGADGNTLLTTVVSMDQMNVSFDVPERVIHRLLKTINELGEGALKDRTFPLDLGFPEEEGYPIHGRIDFLDNRVDPTTGTAIVRGLFDNDSGLLYPGRFVNLRVPQEPIENAILVDEQAIGTDLGGKYVLVVGGDNIVEQKQVELGPAEDGMRVVLKGLTGDESYIVKGIQRARPGRPVRTQQASAVPTAVKPAAETTPPNESGGEAASG
jgi:RND family efflux transporter MFP subunit